MVGRPLVVLGLDFGGTKIAMAVCDLQGNRLASATLGTGAGGSAQGGSAQGASPGELSAADTVFQRGVRAARGLLATAAPAAELAAVGAATFGIPYEDRVELAPAIDGWERLALGRELREAFGVPVRMATDAKAAAAAEWRWGALHGCDPSVYLNLGTGLSAALVAGGQVITGGNGASGEIGYNLRTISDVGRGLGQRTMLEETVSGRALSVRASGQPGQASQLTAADAFEAATTDPELSELIDEFTDELAFHLVNLAILINPVRIAVGGGLVRSWDRIGPRLQAALGSGPPFPPELVVADFPYDAPLLGAVALAIDAATGSNNPAPSPAPAPSTAPAPAPALAAAASVAATAPVPATAPLAAHATAGDDARVTSGTLRTNTGSTA
jgi:glucokinase